MSTRMDRYKDTPSEEIPLSRVKKNDALYDEIKTSELSRVKTNSNVKVLENSGKTINIEKIRKYLEDNKNENVSRRTKIVVDDKNIDYPKDVEVKEYDLNSVLEKAKRNREIDYESERYKKIKSAEVEILNKIKEYDTIYSDSDDDEELNTGERTLVDLINTVAINEDDLLSDLTGGATGEITLPIEEEKTKNDIIESIKKEKINISKVDTSELKKMKEEDEELSKTKELRNLKEKTTEFDKSFFTNSLTFSKQDFEGFEELEKSVKKNNILSKVIIGAIVLCIVVSLVLIINYVFHLGLF